MTTTASKDADPHLDVVFVHGLGSDDKAWLNKETKFDWPTKLECDQRLRVLNITHHAPMFKIRDTGAVEARFEQTAISFLDKLKNQKVGERPIVFVTHSLGGIIVKEALRVSQRGDGDPILKMTRCVIFLSTPHAGAAVANVAGYLAPSVRSLGALAALLGPYGILVRWVIEPIAFIVRSSSLTSQLKKNDAALLSLNYWYRSLSNIETHAFYETERTYRCVHVVDPASADPGVPGCEPIRADSKDHISICKPPDENDQLFVSVARLIEDVREREGRGKYHPVFRKEIGEELVADTRLASFKDAGNFRDIRAANDTRRHAEKHLRQRFRKRFEAGEPINASQEQKVEKSKYDIDKFVLSLWLETKVAEQLKTLSTFIAEAEASVRDEINAEKPPTLILLYRAARTLEKVLLGLDYVTLGETLRRAHETVLLRAWDKTFDTDKATQKLLKRLEAVARGFDEVKRSR
jgi:pimeloyl-ACP methyl ester carboxylesterase